MICTCQAPDDTFHPQAFPLSSGLRKSSIIVRCPWTMKTHICPSLDNWILNLSGGKLCFSGLYFMDLFKLQEENEMEKKKMDCWGKASSSWWLKIIVLLSGMLLINTIVNTIFKSYRDIIIMVILLLMSNFQMRWMWKVNCQGPIFELSKRKRFPRRQF